MASGTLCRIYGNAAGTNFINSIVLTAPVPVQDWQLLANKVDQDWIRNLNTFQGQSVIWTAVQISHLDPGGPASQIFNLNRPGAGLGLLPMQVAYVIRLGTGQSGRSRQGRWFLGGLNTAANSNGMPSSTHLAQFPAALAAIKTAWTTNNNWSNGLGIYSRKLDQVTLITSFTVSPIFGTLRSRRFSVGI